MSSADVLEKPAIVTSPSTANPASPSSFRDSMRALAGGVCVITTGREGQRAGFTATAVCSLTAEPPRLLICVNRTVSSYESLITAGRLGVNVLAQEQEPIAKMFAGMVGNIKGEDRFESGDWREIQGVPLLQGASANFVCSISELIPQGTHTIFLCDVLHASRGAESPAGPLVYANGGFATLARPRQD